MWKHPQFSSSLAGIEIGAIFRSCSSISLQFMWLKNGFSSRFHKDEETVIVTPDAKEDGKKNRMGKFNCNVISSTCDLFFFFVLLLNCKIDWKEMCVFVQKKKFENRNVIQQRLIDSFFFRRHLQKNEMNIQYYLLNVFICRCAWSSANCQWSECSIYWLHPKKRRRKSDGEPKIAPMHTHSSNKNWTQEW